MANNLGVNTYTVGGMFDTWGAAFVQDLAIFNKFAGDTYAISNTSGTVTLDVTACQNFAFRADGGTASQVDIRVPDGISRWWMVENARASGAITVRCAAGGTSVTLNPGERRMVRSDGTNCTDLVLTTVSIASVVGLQAALDLKATIASPTFTGTPAAPTAGPGTNTTQIATTAFVTAALVSRLPEADASNPSKIYLYEATPNGTNKGTIAAPAALSADRTWTFPDADLALIGGALGSTDNRLLRADGTGGVTAQGSAITVDDSGNMSGVGTLSASGNITAPGFLGKLVPDSTVTNPAIDSTSKTVTIADGANSTIAGYEALIVVGCTTNGSVGVYLMSNGSGTLIASVGSLFVSPTTTPAAGKAAMGFSTLYKLYNATGGSLTFVITAFRVGP